MNSSQTTPCTEVQSSQNAQAVLPRLTKVKPWVFRPKKVLYSLSECAPPKKSYSTSHWNHSQNQKYLQFLLKFKHILQAERKMRRKWHLNRIMSKHLGTRSHEQCRSHHQKMIKTYRSLEGIIQHFQKMDDSTHFIHQTSQDSKTDQQPTYADHENGLFEVVNWSDHGLDSELPLPFLDDLESDFI